MKQGKQQDIPAAMIRPAGNPRREMYRFIAIAAAAQAPRSSPH
jgi:hypothetical protein